MALRRLNPQATIRLVSQFDPSILQETDEELEALKKAGKNNRYAEFLENFNIDVLKSKEGETLTVYHARCLKTDEVQEINKKYLFVDTVNKIVDYRDKDAMYLEIAAKAVTGVEEDGKVNPISNDELGYTVAAGLGTLIWIMTTLRKNEKNA